MAKKSNVVLNSVIYTVCGMLQKCFSLVLLPLYTAYLTPNDKGIIDITGSFVTSMTFVVAFSLYSAVMRFYVDLKDDAEKLKRFYGTVVSFVFISGFAFLLIFILTQELLEKYLFVGIPFYPLILVCILQLIFTCQHTLHTHILKSQQRAGKLSILSIIYFLTTVGLNILFVVGFNLGALGILLAGMISGILYTMYFIIDMRRTDEIKFCVDFGLLKSALKYSIPIMPHNLSTHLATFISNALIGGTASLSALGVYGVAIQFGNVADMIQVYVNNAYGPWLYEKLHDKEQGFKKTIRSTVNMLCSAVGLFFIGIALFAKDFIVLFIDENYVSAWPYVIFLVLVFAIKTIYYFYVNVLFYYKKASKLLFTATLSSSIVNLLLSAVLIPMYGVYGSIGADAIAMLLRVAIIVFISKKFDDIGLKVRDFVKNFVVIASFIFIGHIFSFIRFSTTFNIYDFIYRIAVLLVYIIICYFAHKQTINSFLQSLKNKRGAKK